MLEPEKKKARESDAQWRAQSVTITNSLNKLKSIRERWIERNQKSSDAIPSKEDIIAEFGEQAWPQSNFPPGAEYVFTPDGKPACIMDGKTITMETGI